MKLLITGGRCYADKERLYATLDAAHANTPIKLLIHGCASGADSLAGEWARDRGVQPVECPALWKFYESMAGAMRNTAMLSLQPDQAIAFPGKHGTANMVKKLKKAGIPVLELT